MKIRLLSDLHTEFKARDYRLLPMCQYLGEDVLVLAGDIAVGANNTLAVIQHFKAQGFPHIVYVPGNHEYYKTNLQDFDRELRAGCAKMSGVHFLNADSVVINSVEFIGATLWTCFDNSPIKEMSAARMISDFKVIDQFNTQLCVEKYVQHSGYIKAAYENSKHKKVIVTHFLPAKACISPKYTGDTTGLNSYFANGLDNWIATLENTTWMFGHTHDTVDKVIGTTRLVSNPLGYPHYGSEGKSFVANKTIEV